jgi:hypothetical protein
MKEQTCEQMQTFQRLENLKSQILLIAKQLGLINSGPKELDLVMRILYFAMPATVEITVKITIF